MDVDKALRDLYEEKRRLDVAIATLEAHLQAGSPSSASRARRGRKSMSAEERLEVSRRMSKYWEARRAAMKTLASARASTATG
jgi:hypothetical protein